MTVFIASLPERTVIEIEGEGTLAFLQDLVTANVAGLSPGEAAHGALLTPQGKILFDFFVLATDDGVLIDCAKDSAASLVQKLTLYRLRRALSIEPLNDLAVAAIWGTSQGYTVDGGRVFADPRNANLGARVIAPATQSTLSPINRQNPIGIIATRLASVMRPRSDQVTCSPMKRVMINFHPWTSPRDVTWARKLSHACNIAALRDPASYRLMLLATCRQPAQKSWPTTGRLEPCWAHMAHWALH